MIDVERAVALQKKGWSLRQLAAELEAHFGTSMPFNVSDVVSARHLGIVSATLVALDHPGGLPARLR